jgi:predicted ATPase
VLDQSLLRSVRLDPRRVPDPPGFPFELPAVAALEEGLAFHPQVTCLVGENGSGKSTIVEAIAAKLDLDAEGGDTQLTFVTREAESPLHEALVLTRGARRPAMRYFLRAESFYNVARDIDALGGERLAAHGGRELHRMSHGESFLTLALERWVPDGVYILDEPEAALSPQGCLSLLRRIRELALDGAQFVLATHSPILMAYPDGFIYELGDRGVSRVAYEDTDHYRITRSFLENPQGFLHHLFS